MDGNTERSSTEYNFTILNILKLNKQISLLFNFKMYFSMHYFHYDYYYLRLKDKISHKYMYYNSSALLLETNLFFSSYLLFCVYRWVYSLESQVCRINTHKIPAIHTYVCTYIFKYTKVFKRDSQVLLLLHVFSFYL